MVRAIVGAFAALIFTTPIGTADPSDPMVEWMINQYGSTVCVSFGETVDGTDLTPIARFLATAHPVRNLTYEQKAEVELGSIQRFCPENYAPFVQLVKDLKVRGFESLWGGTPDTAEIQLP